MAYQVVWTKQSLSDLSDLVRNIARDDSDTAERFGDLLVSKVDGLIHFPRIGRMVPECKEDSLREIIVSPYRILYEIDDDRMVLSILLIWHSSRGDLNLLE